MFIDNLDTINILFTCFTSCWGKSMLLFNAHWRHNTLFGDPKGCSVTFLSVFQKFQDKFPYKKSFSIQYVTIFNKKARCYFIRNLINFWQMFAYTSYGEKSTGALAYMLGSMHERIWHSDPCGKTASLPLDQWTLELQHFTNNQIIAHLCFHR